MNDKNLLVIAISISFGLGFNMMPTLFSQMPETVQMFTGNGIVMSSLTAIVLNLFFNGLPKETDEVTGALATVSLFDPDEDSSGFCIVPLFVLLSVI